MIERTEKILTPLELAVENLLFKANQIRRTLDAASSSGDSEKAIVERLDVKGLQLLLQGAVQPTVRFFFRLIFYCFALRNIVDFVIILQLPRFRRLAAQLVGYNYRRLDCGSTIYYLQCKSFSEHDAIMRPLVPPSFRLLAHVADFNHQRKRRFFVAGFDA